MIKKVVFFVITHFPRVAAPPMGSFFVGLRPTPHLGETISNNMAKPLKNKILLFFVIIFINIGINPTFGKNNKLVINIPIEISLQKNEIIPLVANLNKKTAFKKIEIVFFYFSTGIERISYNGKSTISQTIIDGGIKALLKFKNKKKLVKVIFVEVKGKGKKDIFNKFHKKINKL